MKECKEKLLGVLSFFSALCAVGQNTPAELRKGASLRIAASSRQYQLQAAAPPAHAASHPPSGDLRGNSGAVPPQVHPWLGPCHLCVNPVPLTLRVRAHSGAAPRRSVPYHRFSESLSAACTHTAALGHCRGIFWPGLLTIAVPQPNRIGNLCGVLH